MQSAVSGTCAVRVACFPVFPFHYTGHARVTGMSLLRMFISDI